MISKTWIIVYFLIKKQCLKNRQAVNVYYTI